MAGVAASRAGPGPGDQRGPRRGQLAGRRTPHPPAHARRGRTFSPEVARDDLARIFGLGDFEAVDLALETPNGEGRRWSTGCARSRGGRSTCAAASPSRRTPTSANSLTVLAGLRATRLNALGGEWATELSWARDASSGPSSTSRSTSTPAGSSRRRLRYNSGRSADLRRRATVAELDVHAEAIRADLGHVFGRYGEMRLGVGRSWSNIDRRSGVGAGAHRGRIWTKPSTAARWCSSARSTAWTTPSCPSAAG